MKKHKAGVWYPASDPPEENIYNIALCVSGKWADNITYHYAVILDDENGYEDGKFYIKGHAKKNMTVHGWYMVPECLPKDELQFREDLSLKREKIKVYTKGQGWSEIDEPEETDSMLLFRFTTIEAQEACKKWLLEEGLQALKKWKEKKA